jgi:hypothetical protein
MTEAEWLGCTDPQKMLEFLRGKAGDRPFRLFAVACCRRLWGLLVDERSRAALAAAERCAEDAASREELSAALDQAEAVVLLPDGQLDLALIERRAANVVAVACTDDAYIAASESAGYAASLADALEARPPQADLLRCIFGNPFRPSLPLPSAVLAWNDATVRRIAVGIYDDRAFDHLPILADALLDAGCENADLLGHLRGPGPHVRGCWAVDLLLGKG